MDLLGGLTNISGLKRNWSFFFHWSGSRKVFWLLSVAVTMQIPSFFFILFGQDQHLWHQGSLQTSGASAKRSHGRMARMTVTPPRGIWMHYLTVITETLWHQHENAFSAEADRKMSPPSGIARDLHFVFLTYWNSSFWQLRATSAAVDFARAGRMNMNESQATFRIKRTCQISGRIYLSARPN